MKKIIFYLGMGTLFTHELDAMFNHEWRILPLTSWLPEETAMLVFLFFHIPLFAGLIALVASKNNQVRFRTRIGISVFLLFHAALHAFFVGNPAYEFSSISSTILIYGGALLGAIHLVLEYKDRSANS
jgi:hypothetical protein